MNSKHYKKMTTEQLMKLSIISKTKFKFQYTDLNTQIRHDNSFRPSIL